MINYNRLGYEIKRDLTNFSTKITQNLKRPQKKFVHQMLYGILAGNKMHLNEIARSLKENITLKKTIDRLSRNLNAFEDKQPVMQNYLALVKRHVKEDYAVIIIDNSDIAKPASRKLEALSEIRDGGTDEITQGYLTIEAAVLSARGKMPLPVYEKVFSAAESGFISETYENLRCLESLSENFSPKCVRTLDRRFDANDYYRMDFTDKSGRTVNCKMSCIPVRLCEFPAKELVLTVVYGFGEEPMLLLSDLRIQEKKKLCHIVAKVYLLRWRIEECSKRIYDVPKFIFYALGYALERILSMSYTGISAYIPQKVKSQQINLFEYFKIADSEGFAY